MDQHEQKRRNERKKKNITWKINSSNNEEYMIAFGDDPSEPFNVEFSMQQKEKKKREMRIKKMHIDERIGDNI